MRGSMSIFLYLMNIWRVILPKCELLAVGSARRRSQESW